MPRIRGPKAIMPAVDNPFLLNNAFYGAHTRGGKSGELSADLRCELGRRSSMESDL